MADAPHGSGHRRVPRGALLVLPFAGLLYPPMYARREPELGGVPFFYWYQLGWVVLSAVLTFVVVRGPGAVRAEADEQ